MKGPAINEEKIIYEESRNQSQDEEGSILPTPPEKKIILGFSLFRDWGVFSTW
jgi:hypothetical protein